MIRNGLQPFTEQIMSLTGNRIQKHSIIWCRQQTQTRFLSSKMSGSKPIRPYSPSLPCPGYEWCNRCHIPSKSLQKPIGVPNPCWEKPGLCTGAHKYYRTQMASMGLLMAFCFGWATYEQQREQAWRTPPQNTRLFQRSVTRTLVSYHNNIVCDDKDDSHVQDGQFSSHHRSTTREHQSTGTSSARSNRKEVTIVDLWINQPSTNMRKGARSAWLWIRLILKRTEKRHKRNFAGGRIAIPTSRNVARIWLQFF